MMATPRTPPGVDFKTPLVSTGQGDYRRDYTPRLERPKWWAHRAWWRTLRNPFSSRTA